MFKHAGYYSSLTEVRSKLPVTSVEPGFHSLAEGIHRSFLFLPFFSTEAPRSCLLYVWLCPWDICFSLQEMEISPLLARILELPLCVCVWRCTPEMVIFPSILCDYVKGRCLCAIFIWVFVRDVVFWINIFLLTSVTKLQIVLPSGRAQQKAPMQGACGGHFVESEESQQNLLGFG